MDEAGRKRLWDDYARTRSSEVREKIILEYAPLVKVVAGRLGITEDEYTDWQSQMKITNLVSLNEYIEQGSDVSNEKGTNVSRHFDSPEKTVEKSELAEMLKSALTLLTEKERRVIELYYYEELTMKEISHILEVTESRVSQLHTRGLQKMKTKMGDYMDFLSDI